MRKLINRWRVGLTRDDGVVGLVLVAVIAVVAFTTLAIILGKLNGPQRTLEQVQATSGGEKLLRSALLARFDQQDSMPCPDTDLDGAENTPCTGTSTTSGTIPWSTLGISRDDALDAYGTFYTYVVAGAEADLCISVPNDYDSSADPEYTGETKNLSTLQIIPTTAGAKGRYVAFAVISHGKNRLGGVSSNGVAISDPPAGSNELVNATANPTTIYTGPYDSAEATYFDDAVWAPSNSDLQSICSRKTVGEQVNADLVESFNNSGNAVDTTKFDTSTASTTVTQAAGKAVFSDGQAYMTTAASYVLNTSERPLYISAEWTPDVAAAHGGFSIITRAEQTPTSGEFDPGIKFQFFDGTGTAGANQSITITDSNGTTSTQVPNFVAGSAAGVDDDDTFTLTFGETYLLEVYDNGSEVWMQISQKNLTSNRAYAYATAVTGDTSGTRVAFVNGTTSVSRLDNIVIGRPMLALDTHGVGSVATSANTNDSTTGRLTLEAWVRPRTLPSGTNIATLISQWDTTQVTRSQHRLYMSDGGALYLQLGDGNSATPFTQALGVSLDVDTWTHVAVAFDDTSHGEITVYINGAWANTITGTASSPILFDNPMRSSALEIFMVGADHDGADAAQNKFDGMISDVRVWSAVRTASQISSWYDRRLPLVDPGDTSLDDLVVNWKFDLESGGLTSAQVSDSPSSHGAVGAISGGAKFAGALLNINRPTSTDICGTTDNVRVGAFRCDYRTAVNTKAINGNLLVGLETFYAKAWGSGGGADTSPSTDGGGGGFAGGLFQNTAGTITIKVGAGGPNANGATAGDDSYLDQGTQRVTGHNGTRGNNGNLGDRGSGAVSGSLITSVTTTGVADARSPGCVPAITLPGAACSDSHYSTNGAPTSLPGYGGDSSANGQNGLVVLFW